MNFTLLQCDLFIRSLKTAIEIDEIIQIYLSPEGMLMLSNYLDYDNLESQKPTYFCYIFKEFFSKLDTNIQAYKQPKELSPELTQKMQQLNARMDTAVFQLNIRQIYPAIKVNKSKLSKIEFSLGNTIRGFRVVRLFEIIFHFQDSLSVIEIPVQLLDEVEQMEIIRQYMESHEHIDIVEVNKEVAEYLKNYHQNELLEMIFNRTSIEIQSKTNQKSISLELDQSLLNVYNFNQFKQYCRNYNSLTLKPNLLQCFTGLGFKLSISKPNGKLARLFLQYQENNQISILLKSITQLNNKLRLYTIQDEDLLYLFQLTIRKDIEQSILKDASPNFQEPQTIKKIKFN